MKVIRNSILLILLLVLTACGISETEEVTRPGFLKVYITYNTPDELKDAKLLTTARDFILYNGEYYTDVFQDPEQFQIKENAFVNFNLFGEFDVIDYDNLGNPIDTTVYQGADKIQVAYGSVPPGDYDRLLFQVTPTTDLFINGQKYPIAKSNTDLNVEIQDTISSVVKIHNNFNIQSDKVTSIHVLFDAKENVYRILDQFVFNTKVKSFSIENE